MLSLRLLVLLALSSLSSCAPQPSKAPRATVEAGVVIGTATSVSGAASATAVNKYLGVPFAASPTRFMPPASATPFTKPYNATRYGLTCPQQFDYPAAARQAQIAFFDTPMPAGGEGEDCLNVNIFVPVTETKNKTVMVWIYGGGLTFGSNALTTYDGTSFAANQDIILVAINYRTNVFGFPGAPGLPLNATNLGFLDQRFALQWVQRNIHAFGGSPHKVTIFGESAGAASVDTLVITNPTNPPFRAAISESGTSELYTSINAPNAPQGWNALVKGLNCTGNALACVRAANQSTITNIIEHNAIDFRPVIDNYTLDAHPETRRASGNIARVPWMTGNNANEGRIFVIGDTNTTAYLEETFMLTAQQAAGLESLYPIPSLYINDSYTQLSQIFTEFVFQCPAALAFNGTHEAGIPAWRYFYNATFPNQQFLGGSLGVYHSIEIATVFGTYLQANSTTEQRMLSKYMQTAWATFAKTPMKGPGWPSWPDVAVLGPIPSAQGYSGMGTRYDVKVNGTLGRVLDARCAAYNGSYELLGVF